MKKHIRLTTIIVLFILLVFGSSLAAFSGSPYLTKGNDPGTGTIFYYEADDTTFLDSSEYYLIKFDPPNGDQTSFGNNVIFTSNGETGIWTSTLPIHFIFVKTGTIKNEDTPDLYTSSIAGLSGGFLYDYGENGLESGSVTTPGLKDISHATFFFKIIEEPEDPEDPIDPEDPTDPEDPIDPEEPEDPIDPEEPQEPQDPEEPEDPVDSTTGSIIDIIVEDPIEEEEDPIEQEDPIEIIEEEDPIEIVEEETPLGDGIIEEEVIIEEEIIEEDEVIIEEEIIEEEEIVLDEEIPLGNALPQTGQLPIGYFYGFGSAVSGLGVWLKRKR